MAARRSPSRADVGDREAVANVRMRAVERFGRIDTWINDAGVAIYGATTDVPWDDQRRLFDTNYWGVVAGSLEAVAQFRAQREAGVSAAGKLINVGSVLSDRAMMFQGPYSASKHAVKGFTDALRMELEEAGEPVSVTLVKPGAIDTAYMEHARNYTDSAGTRNPPPSYDPELVAKAMEHASENDPARSGDRRRGLDRRQARPARPGVERRGDEGDGALSPDIGGAAPRGHAGQLVRAHP